MTAPTRPPTLLVIEDNDGVAEALTLLFEVHGFQVVRADSPMQARHCLASESFDLVLQDMNFAVGATSGDEGVALFREIRRLRPHLPVLLLTAWTSLETAVALMREGACDYLAKPWDDTKLLQSVRNALEVRPFLRSPQPALPLPLDFDGAGVVFRSPAMQAVVRLACRIAKGDVHVLITGPNGAGKEKLAELIVANSPRRRQPFVRVNAGALPESLIEAELFGVEPGAYTGATKRRMGRFEAADGGTLMLDEIGNLSALGQMRLLRILQTGEFQRLGSNETRRANVRVIAATNADLPELIAQGKFREDLYYRLNVAELRLPPLVQRREDIAALATHFLTAIDPTFCLSEDALQRLEGHDWPGNVRELSNTIARAHLLASSNVITADELDIATAPVKLVPPEIAPLGKSAAFHDEADAADRLALAELLQRVDGNVSQAAAQLGMSRPALYRRMQKLGIVVERRTRS